MTYVTIIRRIVFMCSLRSIYSTLNVSASLVTVGLSCRRSRVSSVNCENEIKRDEVMIVMFRRYVCGVSAAFSI